MGKTNSNFFRASLNARSVKGFFMVQYVVTAAVRMLDLSPISHALAIRRALDTWSSRTDVHVKRASHGPNGFRDSYVGRQASRL